MAIAIGGDSDTIACMAGGVAEAYYDGVPQNWKQKAIFVMEKRGCVPQEIIR